MRLRLAFLSLGLVACEVSGTTTTYTPYTAVYVDPTDFTGGVACGSAEGAMQSYVATLIDVTAAQPLIIGSSPPTDCRLSVGFSQIVLGHFYVAQIDAYTQPACGFQQLTSPAGGGQCLVPAGPTVPGVNGAPDTVSSGWGSGVRAQVLAVNGQAPAPGSFVDPAWTTSCGRVRTAPDGGDPVCTSSAAGASGSSGQAGTGGQAGAAGQGGAGQGGAGAGGASGGAGASGSGTSGSGTSNGTGGSLDDVPGSSGQSYVPPPYRTFCSTDPTEAVYQVNARIAGCVALAAPTGTASIRLTTDALRGSLPCGSVAGTIARFSVQQDGGDTRTPDCGEDLLYTDLTPGAYVQWRVFAYEQGSTTPRWGATCRGRAQAGLTVTATCDALQEQGSLRLSGAEICTEGVSLYRASTVGSSTPAVAQQCPGDLVLQGQAPGAVEVLVERRGPGGQTVDAITCEGQVLPGLQATGTCSL